MFDIVSHTAEYPELGRAVRALDQFAELILNLQKMQEFMPLAAEAQAIAMRLEHKTSPRPMTHDLFASFAQAFGLRLLEVFIYRFEDGIYSSEMTFSDGDRTVKLDARTSDAIATAMRTGAPIYTTPQILKETGFVIENDPFTSNEDNSESGDRKSVV